MAFLLVIAVVLTAAVSPMRAAEPLLVFEDRFDGKLGEGWAWIREDKPAWRIREGGLEIRVQPGKAGTVKNALVRDIPNRGQEKWVIEVNVTNLSQPIQQYEQAGMTWYRDGKPIFKLVKELVDGKTVIVPGKIPIAEKTVRLRLTVHGNRYVAEFRPKGQEQWRQAATGTLPAAGKDQIGLQCYDGPPAAEHWMRFSEFRISRQADGAAPADRK
jgi:regulation of enolase protein 1 (concanavalin A-like superfamily)